MYMLITLVIVIMLILFLLNVPIYISMLCGSILYFTFNDANMLILIQKMLSGVQRTSLLAIPFFIMAGVCMNVSR